jgi:hypothetical protein
MPSHSSSDLDWVTNPGQFGRVGSFPVSIKGPRIFKHVHGRTHLVCVIPETSGLSAQRVALLTHLACQHSAKLANANISTKAYLKLVSSFLPPTQFGQKTKPDLPLDDLQHTVIAHRGARCDSETSSQRAGFNLQLCAPNAPLTKATAFVPGNMIEQDIVWRSAADVVMREILAATPSTKHDRAAALAVARTKHLQLVR